MIDVLKLARVFTLAVDPFHARISVEVDGSGDGTVEFSATFRDPPTRSGHTLSTDELEALEWAEPVVRRIGEGMRSAMMNRLWPRSTVVSKAGEPR